MSRQILFPFSLSFLPVAVVVLLLADVSYVYGERSGVPCTDDIICQDLQGEGSVCRTDTGFCTNPFEQGCLYRRKEGWNKKRVCNSEDPPNAAQDGLCDEPQFEYMEVRPVSGNWESIFFNAWILQIVLSEMLGVPTTLEPGMANTHVSLYDSTGAVEYGRSANVYAFSNAKLYKDCRLMPRDPGATEDEYEACGHIIPEFWSASGTWATQMINEGSMEPPQSLGVLAQETIFIPKFTAERDPTLLSYIGLQGEKNRQKLADTFLRPTLWSDYCREESSDGCATPDDVAQRAPIDDDEGKVYFVQDEYTGYFRKTEESMGNATHNATGHIIDYPCDWTSYAEQQIYHLDIALSGDRFGEDVRGYDDWRHMHQIISAANATKSNIIIMWAKPDPTYQSLMGTDMELHPVQLPAVTQECLAHKLDADAVCSADMRERVGDPRGACEDPPLALHLAMSTSLTQLANDAAQLQEGDGAGDSPAVDAIKLYSTSTAIYGSFFNLAIDRNALETGRSSLLRDAACQWAVDNFDILERFVPFSYPRVLQDGEQNSPLVAASVLLGSLSVLLVLLASAIVYKYRHRRVMIYAQIDFLWLLLIGLLMMSIGALLLGVTPTMGTCVTAVWFVNIGFTVALAPLLVKVSAINRLMRASRRMNKVEIKRQNLLRTVIVVTSVMVIFLIVWTVVDPPEVQGELSLTTRKTEDGETIAYRTNYCSSESDVWQYISFGWMGVLLLSATVLAIEMRNVRQEFNESLTLGFMTYSHFVFAILRVVCYFLSDTLGEADSIRYRSILFSVDTMATLVIYFLPKFIALRQGDSLVTGGSSRSVPKYSANSEPSAESRARVHFEDSSNNCTNKQPEQDGEGQENENAKDVDEQRQREDAENGNQKPVESTDSIPGQPILKDEYAAMKNCE